MSDDPKVVNLAGRRPMYGDNWPLAEQWLGEFEADLAEVLHALREAIAQKNKGEFLGTMNSLIEQVYDLSATIRGDEE